MKLTCLVLASAVVLAACGQSNTPNNANAPAPNAANTAATPATPAADADAVVAKAWDYLKTMYNVPAPDDDRAGINAGWGPQSKNIPYTAMVLYGLHGTKAWDPANEMIKSSVEFVLTNQEPAGSFSYMPIADAPGAKGMRAVYITAICAQLFAELNTTPGPWQGKLGDAIAKARDYLRQAQVGNADGPAPDYDAKSPGFGGWAYSKEEIGKSVGQDNKPPANMSTSTYAIDALKACGLDPTDPLWGHALVFLKRNQNAGEVQDEGFEAIDKATGKRIKPAAQGSPDYGGAIYSEESTMAESQQNEDGTVTLFSYGSMTYNLLRSYLYAGLSRDSVPVRLAWGWIQRNYTVKRVPGFRTEASFEMGLYYYYSSMARTLNAWGADHVEDAERGTKHDWRADLKAELASRQKENGSWVNDKHNRWQENSPVLCTAYALDALKHAK